MNKCSNPRCIDAACQEHYGSQFAGKLKVMSILEERGIVRELMPQPNGFGGSIWSWEVLKPEMLPEMLWLQANLITNNGMIVL